MLLQSFVDKPLNIEQKQLILCLRSGILCLCSSTLCLRRDSFCLSALVLTSLDERIRDPDDSNSSTDRCQDQTDIGHVSSLAHDCTRTQIRWLL
jgi:hypothetical protein